MATGYWLSATGQHGIRPIGLMLLALLSLPLWGVESAGRTGPDPLTQAREAEADLQRAIVRAQAAFIFIGGGSGVCISADGYIFTNHHVVQRHVTWNVRVFGTNHLYVADVVGTDPLGDVALLKIRNARALPFAPLADVKGLRVGQPVLALGDPYKLGDLEGPPSVSLGTLCGLHRYQNDPQSPASSFYADALQTDAAVNPGSSGGPLFDLEGRLLGLTGQIMSRFGGKANSGIAYAVPADQLARFLPAFKQANGMSVHHGTLPQGLKLAWNTQASSALPGAVVENVKKDSSAERAGFRAGDRVTEADGEPVNGPHRLLGIVQSRPEGTLVRFIVQRGEAKQELKLTLPRY